MSESEINSIISQNINEYLKRHGKSQLDLAIYMGVSQATVSNWCKGIKMPRMDKIDKICSFFKISRSDLMEKPKDENHDDYYLDEDSRETAQFLFENPDYKVLFDASRKVRPEDIGFVKELLDRFSKDN